MRGKFTRAELFSSTQRAYFLLRYVAPPSSCTAHFASAVPPMHRLSPPTHPGFSTTGPKPKWKPPTTSVIFCRYHESNMNVWMWMCWRWESGEFPREAATEKEWEERIFTNTWSAWTIILVNHNHNSILCDECSLYCYSHRPPEYSHTVISASSDVFITLDNSDRQIIKTCSVVGISENQ